MTEVISVRRALFVTGGIALAGLMAMILTSPAALLYDERLHFPGVRLLAEIGFGKAFLLGLDSAVGPLYAIIHRSALPLTEGQGAAVRLINPLLLGAFLAFLAMTLRRWGKDIAVTPMLFALPPLWVLSGMALTEIPALLMVMLGLAALTIEAGVTSSVLSGLAFGLAACGRQPYVALLPMTACVFVLWQRWGWRDGVLHLAAGLPLPLSLFALWGGLVPPREIAHWQLNAQPQAAMGLLIEPRSMILSLGYCGAFLLLMSPRWFRIQPWVLVGGLVAVLANAATGYLNFLPAAGVLSALPPLLRGAGTHAASAALILLAWGFLSGLGLWLWERRIDPLAVVVAFGALGIAIHPGVIAIVFASRYTMMALPFLVLLAADHFRPGAWAMVRLALGAGAGAYILRGYYVTWADLLEKGINAP